MKKFTVASLAVIGLALTGSVASAEELWDPHLRGVNEGLAAGALPPPGVYGVLDNYWAGYDKYNASGNKTGVKLDALVEVPIVLWAPGVKILGADYAVALAQPFDYTSVSVNGAGQNTGHWGTFNTVVVPGELSWALPNDFHVKAGLAVYVKDASSSPGHNGDGQGVGAGNNFWTFEPGIGVSWLSDGWNLSIDSHFDTSTKNTTTDYQSGDEIAIDYTAAKTIGKWTFGVGAHEINQLNSDTGTGTTTASTNCAANKGCKVESYGAGPLIGYQFGGVSITGEYNHNIYTQNDVAGEIFNVRLVAPF